MIESKYKTPDLILDIYSEFGQIGIWYCDKITGEEEISEEWASMLGYQACELNPMSDKKFAELIHPEDLERSEPIIHAFYSGQRLTYENEFRLKHKDGYYFWVSSKAKIYSWQENRPKLVIGTHVNIDRQMKMQEKLKTQTHSIVAAFSKVIELKDMYTKSHLENVANISVKIGRYMNLSDLNLECLYIAGHLHDLGKVQIPKEILNKTGKLTADEYEIVKKHSNDAFVILKEFDFGFPLATIVRQHHERIDGSGYPDGLRKSEILIESQIIAVADTIDAMLTDRPYRSKRSIEEVIETLISSKNIEFDASVVNAALSYLNYLR
ncbi:MULTISPECIES: HD domain-containing phosphohydrolase [unclassified Fusibacter]|uniref:HD domain-containing phosphohydrolase n=1 Tax=unclassified Fusibacter TaxID=2624464 RepID=UPI0010139CCA|nr:MULTISPECIES: HD domain-containing phosphohydrolase [unclassified Fusibacter]MCK8058141.1 HD domain-containing protein [Fusibacter sp. A2]NPE20723.1 HD domain-containing protein [Fusibacter sp. A1]RXV62927.1 HD domain-containing protein [Fusibacter sp. A1]